MERRGALWSATTALLFLRLLSSWLFTTAQDAATNSAEGQGQVAGVPPNYGPLTRNDLLIVIPANTERLHLVKNTRVYRKGIRTFIVTEKLDEAEIKRRFPDPENEYLERWGTYREVLGEQKAMPGDLRAAIAPFLANEEYGATYKWILYGDDDTMWVIPNLLRYLESLDPNTPYLVSDALWFLNKGPPGSEQHHSDEAPRCLPCGYTDPMLDDGTCAGLHGEWKWHAPVACPCTPELLCRADNLNAFHAHTCGQPNGNEMIRREDKPWAPRPGFWYMQHGGAGTLLSIGLMQRATFQQVEDELARMWKHSGDAMMFEIVWNLLGIGPTVPGYSYCRGFSSFDPGFYMTDLGGKGGDPLGVIERLESLLRGTPLCGTECAEQLSHTLTVHIRARFTNFSLEWLDSNPTVPTADLLRNFYNRAQEEQLSDDELGEQLGHFLMARLTNLFSRWLSPPAPALPDPPAALELPAAPEPPADPEEQAGPDPPVASAAPEPPAAPDRQSGPGGHEEPPTRPSHQPAQQALQLPAGTQTSSVGEAAPAAQLSSGAAAGQGVDQSTEELHAVLASEFLDRQHGKEPVHWMAHGPYVVLWMMLQVLGVVLLALLLEVLTGWGLLRMAGLHRVGAARHGRFSPLPKARLNSW